MFGRGKGKEPKRITKLELAVALTNTYTDVYERDTTVVAAERIARAAFMDWTDAAGIGEERAQELQTFPAEVRKGRLEGHELLLVLSAANRAIGQNAFERIAEGES